MNARTPVCCLVAPLPARSRSSSTCRASAPTSCSATAWWSGCRAPATPSRSCSRSSRCRGMLGRLGLRVDPAQLRLRNVGRRHRDRPLRTFSRQGSRLDVTVSALGNARSLVGGTLLVTPLDGADGQTYALAQGPVQWAGSARASTAFDAEELADSGRVPEGGAAASVVVGVRRRRPFVLSLKHPDFTNAQRIATPSSRCSGDGAATALDPAAIEVTGSAGRRWRRGRRARAARGASRSTPT